MTCCLVLSVITSPLFNELGVMLGRLCTVLYCFVLYCTGDYLSLPTILFVPVNDDHFLSMSQGFPNVVSWSGPGSDSRSGTIKTYLINIVYQNIIKPYMFVRQQYQQLRETSQIFPYQR